MQGVMWCDQSALPTLTTSDGKIRLAWCSPLWPSVVLCVDKYLSSHLSDVLLSSVNIAESHLSPICDVCKSERRGEARCAYYVVNIDINEVIILDSYQHIIYN